MSRFVTINEAADALGVSVQTLRRWETEGRLKPDARTSGGQRRYDLARLRPEMFRGADPAGNAFCQVCGNGAVRMELSIGAVARSMESSTRWPCTSR